MTSEGTNHILAITAQDTGSRQSNITIWQLECRLLPDWLSALGDYDPVVIGLITVMIGQIRLLPVVRFVICHKELDQISFFVATHVASHFPDTLQLQIESLLDAILYTPESPEMRSS